jgi:hypothetical protein
MFWAESARKNIQVCEKFVREERQTAIEAMMRANDLGLRLLRVVMLD